MISVLVSRVSVQGYYITASCLDESGEEAGNLGMFRDEVMLCVPACVYAVCVSAVRVCMLCTCVSICCMYVVYLRVCLLCVCVCMPGACGMYVVRVCQPCVCASVCVCCGCVPVYIVYLRMCL